MLSAQDVAARWNVDERTVQLLAARQQLRGFKIGRVWRFSEADVDAYVASQTNAAPPEPAPAAAAAPLTTYSDTYRDLWGGQP